ncbi:hypothetical protein ABH940_003578 [Streptacidiphilus sp. BW17]|uniref:hypothetical protein n=1 Tax=Streptacidiphilus sp. BW17 TaxID=3156274 RepID=UPI003515F589
MTLDHISDGHAVLITKGAREDLIAALTEALADFAPFEVMDRCCRTTRKSLLIELAHGRRWDVEG